MEKQIVIKNENPLEIGGINWNVRKGHSFTKWSEELSEKLIEKNVPFSVRYIYYERGGATRNTGNAVIIAGKIGNKLKSAVIFTGGHLSNGRHVQFNSYYPENIRQVCVWRHRGDFRLEIKDGYDKSLFEMETTTESWRKDLPEKYEILIDAINAAVNKSYDYHCRSAYYYLK